MNTAAVVLRIVLFLAIVGPAGWWIIRRARDAQRTPSDLHLDSHTERARGQAAIEGSRQPPWG